MRQEVVSRSTSYVRSFFFFNREIWKSIGIGNRFQQKEFDGIRRSFQGIGIRGVEREKAGTPQCRLRWNAKIFVLTGDMPTGFGSWSLSNGSDFRSCKKYFISQTHLSRSKISGKISQNSQIIDLNSRRINRFFLILVKFNTHLIVKVYFLYFSMIYPIFFL